MCGSGTWEGLSRIVLPESVIRWSSGYQPGLQSYEGSTGARGSASQVACPHGWQVSTVSSRPQLLTTWASPQGCSSVLTTRQLAAPKQVIPGSKVEALSFLRYPTGYTGQSSWDSFGSELHKGANTRRRGLGGCVLEAGRHTPPFMRIGALADLFTTVCAQHNVWHVAETPSILARCMI